MRGTSVSEKSLRDELPEYHFSGYILDIRGRKLLDPTGTVQVISSRAFDTLHFLLQHCGETLSKQDIMKAVWGRAVVEDNNLNQAIFSLRKVFGDSRNNNQFIKTVPGRGYCFIAPVHVAWVKVAPKGAILGSLVSEFSESGRFRSILPSLALALMFVAMVGSILFLEWRDSNAGQSPGLEEQDVASLEPLAPPDGMRIENSVAVLPFGFLDDGGNELFALGLHDEVISQLSNIRSLKVIARNSVLSLVEQDLPLDEISRLLKVENLLSGTILVSGQNARITLQMQDAATGISLWSQTYDVDQQDMDEMFAVQYRIASDVAKALETGIQAPEQALLSAAPTSSFEAYRFLLAAKMAHYQQDFGQEWELSRQALELDPDYYDALAIFASVNATLDAFPLPGMSSQIHYEYALDTVNRMIELAPDNSKGYAQKAVILGTRKDWAGVTRMVDILRDMNAPMGSLSNIALVLMCLGEFDSAIEIYRAALVTEPLNLYARGFLMAALELAGRQEEAREEFALGEELNPVWWGDAVNIFLALGREEPLQDIDEVAGMSPVLKDLLHNVEDTERVRAGLEAYRWQENKISAEALYYAALAAKTGDQDLALEFYHAALQESWTTLFWSWLPVFDDTRKQEGFTVLLKESGIVDYWRENGWPDVCQPTGDSFKCDWRAYPALSQAY